MVDGMRRMGLLLGLALVTGCGGSGGPKEWVPPTHIPINPVDFDAQAVAEDPEAFPLMVMAGDPRPDSMLVWTRVATAEPVRLRVWLPGIDPDDADRVDLLIDRQVTPDAHGFVHERVAVIPGRFHAYGFFIGADPQTLTGRSPIGRFSAAPPDGALVRLTLSGTHGTHQREAPYPALTANAAFEPYSLFLHLGDSIYSDSAREQTPAACTLDEYLAYWDDNWQTDGFRAALAEAVYLPVPDDHEVANNYDAEFEDPGCPGRVANGHQAYFLENPIEPGPLYRSWRWGDTVEFFMLDCRSERRPSTADDPGADPPIISPDSVYLSAEQMDWLTGALAASPATFKLVLNSVPLTIFPNPPWYNMDACDTWSC
jgi:alkaline phosphatase D